MQGTCGQLAWLLINYRVYSYWSRAEGAQVQVVAAAALPGKSLVQKKEEEKQTREEEDNHYLWGGGRHKKDQTGLRSPLAINIS